MDASTEASSLNAAGPPSVPLYIEVIGVMVLIESILVILLNPITILAVIKSKLAQKSTAHFLIAALSVSDFLCGVQFFCQLVLRMLIPKVGIIKAVVEANWLLYMTSAIIIPTSSCTSLLIGVDRFIAVSYPTQYKQKMKIRNATLMIAAMWVFCILRTLPAGLYKRIQDDQLVFIMRNEDAFPKGFATYFAAPFGVILLLLNVLLYARIFWLFKAQSNKIAGSIGQESSTKRARRLTRLSLILVGVLIGTLSPVILVSFMPKPEGGPLAMNAYNYIFNSSTLLIICPSFVNNIIYAWQHQDYRRAYMKLIGKNMDSTVTSLRNSESSKQPT